MIFVQVEYMIQYLNFLTEIIGQLSIIDMILIIALITFIILIISVIYLYKISTIEIEEEEESEVNDMMDLKEISRQIEENQRTRNIELTPYEQEQEEKAIISYDELIKNNNSMRINYDDEDDTSGILVKKVDLKNIADIDETSNDTEVHAISYKEEEAFLEALKNLKNM